MGRAKVNKMKRKVAFLERSLNRKTSGSLKNRYYFLNFIKYLRNGQLILKSMSYSPLIGQKIIEEDTVKTLGIPEELLKGQATYSTCFNLFQDSNK